MFSFGQLGNHYQPAPQTETEDQPSFLSQDDLDYDELVDNGIDFEVDNDDDDDGAGGVASYLLWNWSEICVSICSCPANAHY